HGPESSTDNSRAVSSRGEGRTGPPPLRMQFAGPALALIASASAALKRGQSAGLTQAVSVPLARLGNPACLSPPVPGRILKSAKTSRPWRNWIAHRSSETAEEIAASASCVYAATYVVQF